MDKSFSDWATIVGGFSGLLSFFYVLYEKMTSGPNVISEVGSAKVYEREPSRSDEWFNYDFTIEVEIGNVGSKLTSLIKPMLKIHNPDSKFELRFAGDNPMSFGVSFLALEPGFANTYTFRCVYRCEARLDTLSFNGVLEFKQIAGKYIRHDILFYLVK